MEFYVTFGQDHYHNINGKIFDKDCIAVIESENCNKALNDSFQIFKNKFCMCNSKEKFNNENLKYYPRGLIPCKVNIIKEK